MHGRPVTQSPASPHPATRTGGGSSGFSSSPFSSPPSTTPSSTSPCRSSSKASTPAPPTCNGWSPATRSSSPVSCSPPAASATGSDAGMPSPPVSPPSWPDRSRPRMATSTTVLIVGRGVMGLGGALIMPTTLSILVNVFGDPRERAKAIAVWTAASGVGIALGPIAGGMLMRSFSWSSVFWINVPLLVAALARHAPPRSRLARPRRHQARPGRSAPVDRRHRLAGLRHHPGTRRRLDLAARRSPTSPSVRRSVRCSSPGSCVVTSRCSTCGCSPTAASPPAASPCRCCSSPWPERCSCRPSTSSSSSATRRSPPASPSCPPRSACCSAPAPAPTWPPARRPRRRRHRHPHRRRRRRRAGRVHRRHLVRRRPASVSLLFGLGAGIAMPAATELIMATLPPARAGVGSAVNDTVRELGGALGVAVIGSVAATSYAASMHSELDTLPRPERHRRGTC